MPKPKLVILGEKPHAASWLWDIAGSGLFDIVAAVTPGRNGWWGGPVFEAVLRHLQIPIVKRKDLLGIKHDILLSLLYPHIIEPEIIAAPEWYALNLHEAPLPEYRGCNCYSHAIMSGGSVYGTTLHYMAPELDCGSIVDELRFPLDDDCTARELYDYTAYLSRQILKRNLLPMAKHELPSGYPIKLDPDGKDPHARDSLAVLRETEGPNESMMKQHVRALDFLPFEPAFYIHNGRKYYMFMAGSPGRHVGNPGRYHGIVTMTDAEYERHYEIWR